MSDEPYESAERWYQENHKVYELICDQVRANIEQALDNRAIHDIQCRAKDAASFSRKSRKRNPDGSLKYIDPINELTDLAAVRIIVFLREDVNRVSETIHELYDVFEDGDVSARKADQTKFGYESRHILIKVDRRQYFGKKKKPQEAVCEIQVRTILQHAWAEMEHDIGYKSDLEIPPDLRRRFSALAGLLEIADSEFERIQKDSLALRSAVKKELVADISRQVMEENQRPNDSQGNAKRVRNLIAQRRYEEAIDRYSDLIDAEPKSVTLYIGRAKAHFLNGATTKAIQDLDTVDELQGPHPSIARLRALFSDGDVSAAQDFVITSTQDHAALLEQANAALQSGEGVEAYDAFCQLEENGYTRAFARFGQAMALTLEFDTEGAQDVLNNIALISATPMKVNLVTLQQIIFAIEDRPARISLSKIKEALSEVNNYTLDLSPLRFFRYGLEKNSDLKSKTDIIFSCLPRSK